MIEKLKEKLEEMERKNLINQDNTITNSPNHIWLQGEYTTIRKIKLFILSEEFINSPAKKEN